MGFHHVAQAGLKLLSSSDPPRLAYFLKMFVEMKSCYIARLVSKSWAICPFQPPKVLGLQAWATTPSLWFLKLFAYIPIYNIRLWTLEGRMTFFIFLCLACISKCQYVYNQWPQRRNWREKDWMKFKQRDFVSFLSWDFRLYIRNAIWGDFQLQR